MYPPDLKSVALPDPEIRGVAKLQTPDFGGGCRRSEMVPFDRALVSLYRPSIVALSLRVSEILSLLFCIMPLFPYPTSSLPKISPCSLGLGGSPFGYKERRCWASCPCN